MDMEEHLTLVLVIVVLIIVIIITKNILLVVIMVSLIANILFISSDHRLRPLIHRLQQLCGHWSKIEGANYHPTETTDHTGHQLTDNQSTDNHVKPMGDVADIYGPFYERWHGYRTAYTDCYDDQRPDKIIPAYKYNIDDSGADLARKRFHDKKCTDGWVTKDANYYKYHFSGELDEAESKRWWGRADW
jgi:type IV secretory pathway VirB3-like protein